MLLRLLIALCRVSPLARRAIWRWWYNKLARRFDQDSWTFMNYGCAPKGDEPELDLDVGDEEDRLCIQLYEHVVSGTDLKGARLLEVGCGRGGGSSYLARRHQPAAMIGIDYSPVAVAFCRERHDVTNLEFKPGDAERLPFEDASFDAVVNVESSHCYGNVDRFFEEVSRALKPGGSFLYADFREAGDVAEWEGALNRAPGTTLVESEDITERVLAAMTEDDKRKRQLIGEFVPEEMRQMFEEFAGLAGAQVYRAFESRDMIYMRYRLMRD